ncbi:ABC transporter substrate-binding protein [Rhizobium leguminosarum]|uniref:ABC transporter substrate-binding protein n=1 Tax=Rhizobium leguminosarum TaxID=384 RepID=UPI0014427551|nr:ABC transporter substrate-binding protein [Rhizobium leguminosarum]
MPAIRTARADCSNPALRIRVGRDFRTFDPADAWGEDAIITRNLLAPLVRYMRKSSGDGWTWKRHIVESMSDDSPRRYQFKLREEAWRNTPNITTEDVAFSFERILGRAGGVSDALNKRAWSVLDTVEVVDPSSATVALRVDRPDFLTTVLPGVAGCVVNKAHVSTLAGGRFTLDPGPTSGRYDLCAVDPGVQARLVADRSWQGDKVEIDSAAFIVITDDNTAKEMWLSRELDVYRPGIGVLRQVVQQGQSLVRTATSRTSILVLNQSAGALANPELRRAVQLAVDRKAVGDFAYADGDPVVATGLIPRGWAGWSEKELTQYNPDEAQRLATSIAPSEPLRIATSFDPLSLRIGEQVQRDLDKIGLRSDILTKETASYWLAIAQNEADILVTMTEPQTSGPLAPFGDFTSLSSLGWNRNAEFDAQYQRTDLEPTQDSLLNLQQLLTAQDIVVPLVEDQRAYLVSENVRPEFDPDGEVGDLGSWARV